MHCKTILQCGIKFYQVCRYVLGSHHVLGTAIVDQHYETFPHVLGKFAQMKYMLPYASIKAIP